VDRRGAARTGSLVLLVAAAMGMTGLVAALATVGGEDDDGLSRSVARAEERGDRPAADLVGAPEGATDARVAADAPADPDAPTGDARLSGAIAGPGWSNGAAVEVELRGVTEEGAAVRRTQSLDGAGARWAFEGLPAGVYVARATATLDPRRAFASSDTIQLAADAPADDVVLRMREYVLEGVVTADDRTPLANLPVTVDWHAARGPALAGQSEELRRAITSYSNELQRLSMNQARIELSLTNLEGSAEPVIETIEVAAQDGEAQRERLRVEAEARRAEFRAAEAAARAQMRAAALELRTSDEIEPQVFISGLALANVDFEGRLRVNGRTVDVKADGAKGSGRLACTTDALGRFKLWLPGPGRGGVLAPGDEAEDTDERWRWYRQGGSPFAVSAEEPRASVEVEISHVGAIRGVVTAPPRTGDQDLEVFVRALGTKRSTQHTTARSGESRDEGTFRFNDLAPGRYVIYGRSGGSAGQDVSHRAVVQVHAGAATRVDLALATSSSVVGVLVDAEGAPLAGARLTAYGEDNDNLSRNGRTDENGRFTIVGMYGGPYVVRADEHALVQEPRLRVPQGGAVVDAGTLRVAPPPDPASESGSGGAGGPFLSGAPR